MSTSTSIVLTDVVDERHRQDMKFGQQNHSPIEWMAILMEEVGEASKEAVEMHFAKDHMTIYPIDVERVSRYRAELVQVAAVAVAMIESMDRNELK